MGAVGCEPVVGDGPKKCRWIVVFLDNVGGEILDAGLTRLTRGARVVLSGGLSQYNADQTRGPSNYLLLIRARASMTGFITPDYAGLEQALDSTQASANRTGAKPGHVRAASREARSPGDASAPDRSPRTRDS